MLSSRPAHELPLVRKFSVALALVPALAFAEAGTDRFSASGYLRIMAQPDFQGGSGGLGYSDLYGRLLNEGPYGMLQLQLDVLRAAPGTNETWASVVCRIEGNSFQNADANNGSLAQFNIKEMYVRAGNILFDHVTWQLGTLRYWPGDLGLYDLRPATIFDDTVGLSARYDVGMIELLIGLGDAGYALHGSNYNSVASTGAWLRLRCIPGHLELGLGGQFRYEPAVPGDQNAPYATPGIAYVDYVRQDVVAKFLEENPGQITLFPNPQPRDASSYAMFAYLGFGNFGPVKWNNFFARFERVHPVPPYAETYVRSPGPQTINIYVTDLTAHRYQFEAGDEIQLTLIPGRLDAALAGLVGYNFNKENTVSAGNDNYRVRLRGAAVAALPDRHAPLPGRVQPGQRGVAQRQPVPGSRGFHLPEHRRRGGLAGPRVRRFE